ncbi:MAG TPA: hypothetical protein VFI20_05410 [Terracidiphilus sp.]|nr:hypothetical protein [Terracidiphilus sp.]
MIDAPGPLRLWHLASLDAPTVAVVWALGLAWTAEIHLPLWMPVLVALGSWTVYIGDRLLDARSGIRAEALHDLRERHFFHWRHRRVLIPLAAASACAAAIIIFAFMPQAARRLNFTLAAAALAYFCGVHSPRPPLRLHFISKECLVGLLFAAGCALPALSHWHMAGAAHSSLLPLALPIAFFACLAWLNCHAVERWESGGSSQTTVASTALVAAGSFAAWLLASSYPRSAMLLLAAAASALLLLLLDRLHERLTPLALRAAADLVLLTPLFLFLP